ncbi:MAG: glucose-1-phosphate adenylyltransferase subunit GlgD [Firmicutes bacterium]|nr:glucose-1-phosphate adenylyltransferase subunit GlgD [Bacillota bacterium]
MKAMSIIFAHGYDDLGSLTLKRTNAALPFGGRYRQIDFPLSILTNAGIRHIGILTKQNYKSLMNHIGSGEEWNLELAERHLEYMTPNALGDNLYRGKLEAMSTAAMDNLVFSTEDYVVLVDSSVVYNIDVNDVLEKHVASGKDMTIVAVAGMCGKEKKFDMALSVKDDGEVDEVVVDAPGGENFLASVGMFVIGREMLMEHVNKSVARGRNRLERDLIMRQFYQGNLSLNVYRFTGAVLFNESIQEYYNSNLALLNREVHQSIFCPERTIYTKTRDCVPTYYGAVSKIDDCIVADGCSLMGEVEHTVIFRRVTVDKGAHVKDCILMSNAHVCEGAELYCVILDKDTVVRPGVRLIGTPTNPIIIKRGEIV